MPYPSNSEKSPFLLFSVFDRQWHASFSQNNFKKSAISYSSFFHLEQCHEIRITFFLKAPWQQVFFLTYFYSISHKPLHKLGHRKVPTRMQAEKSGDHLIPSKTFTFYFTAPTTVFSTGHVHSKLLTDTCLPLFLPVRVVMQADYQVSVRRQCSFYVQWILNWIACLKKTLDRSISYTRQFFDSRPLFQISKDAFAPF